MAKWRPEGWKTPYKYVRTPSLLELAIARDTDAVKFYQNECFELGADAMLEALEDRGLHIYPDGRIKDDFVARERE